MSYIELAKELFDYAADYAAGPTRAEAGLTREESLELAVLTERVRYARSSKMTADERAACRASGPDRLLAAAEQLQAFLCPLPTSSPVSKAACVRRVIRDLARISLPPWELGPDL
jgi:hypothetical protein